MSESGEGSKPNAWVGAVKRPDGTYDMSRAASFRIEKEAPARAGTAVAVRERIDEALRVREAKFQQTPVEQRSGSLVLGARDLAHERQILDLVQTEVLLDMAEDSARGGAQIDLKDARNRELLFAQVGAEKASSVLEGKILGGDNGWEAQLAKDPKAVTKRLGSLEVPLSDAVKAARSLNGKLLDEASRTPVQAATSPKP